MAEAELDLRDCTLTIKGGGASQSVEVVIGEGNLTFTESQEFEYKRDRGRLDTVREGDEQPLQVSFDAKWLRLVHPTVPAATTLAANVTVGDTSITVASGTGIAAGMTLQIEGDTTLYRVSSVAGAVIGIYPAAVASASSSDDVTFVQAVSVRDALYGIGQAAAWLPTASDPCEPWCVDLEFAWSPACTTNPGETYTFPMFRVESLNPDADAGTISVSGTCNTKRATIVVNS